MKVNLTLRPSESAVFQSASIIYAAYITSGKVNEGEENRWMEKALREAVKLAQASDDVIISDGEFD